MSHLVGGLLLLLLASVACAQSGPLPLQSISLPPGFTIELVARVDNARQMALGPKGTLFVGSMRAGKVYAVRWRSGAPAEVLTLASRLALPVGVAFHAFHNGALYVSAVDRVLRFDDIESHLDDPPKPAVVTDRLPTDRHHGWKFIAFGPDDKLYVSVGAPCNICDPNADRYANIMRMNADGSGLETFARGIRNTVGFDWDPRTQELWFTDNGRDWLGDDSPPDELNHAPRAGMHFGYPYCHGGTISDPEFGRRRPCGDFTPPAQNLGPKGTLFVGSMRAGKVYAVRWRSGAPAEVLTLASRLALPVGVAFHLENGKAIGYEPFATGWLRGTDVWGRPADVLVMPDGSLLVSDDFAGAIYRITYRS